MAEVQTSQQDGDMAQRFLGFVMMQAQQISLFLGQIPHPQTGETHKNLEAAKIFIDQLEMIREKTRGNLSEEESGILKNVLSDLQMAYVQASNETQTPAGSSEGSGDTEVQQQAESAPASNDGGDEPKKKFTKSYGS